MSLILDGTAGVTFPSGSGTQAAQSKVLQVVNATYSTATNTSSNSFVNTGLSASITPLFSTSKILVIVDQGGCFQNGGATNAQFKLQLIRGSTSVIVFDFGAGYSGTTAPINVGSISTNYLDSPATTSTLTYQTQFLSYSNSTPVTVQTNGTTSTITLMEIAA